MEPPTKRQRAATENPREEEDLAGGEEEEEEEEALELAIDEYGRVALLGESAPEYSFRSFPSIIKPDPAALQLLLRDCEAAFTASAAERSGQYSRGDTFWVGADDVPTSRLEQLAQAIYNLHAGSVECDRSKSGAEWWTQVIDAEDDIGWHWDRDYTLEADADIRLHPHLASVTYLSDLGAPTVMLELTEAEAPKGSKPATATVAHLSRPSIGKHISFDGRWLHAAPSALGDAVKEAASQGAAGAAGTADSVSAGARRVTFLVNMWLNHKPLSATSFPKPELLSPALEKAGLDDTSESKPPSVACVAEGAQAFSWPLRAGQSDNEEEGEEEEEDAEEDEEDDAEKASPGQRRVRLALPVAQLAQVLVPGASVTLNLPPGLAAVEGPDAAEEAAS